MLLEALIKPTFDCNYQYPQEKFNTLLHQLCQQTNDLSFLREALPILLKLPGIDTNIANASGMRPLHIAALNPFATALIILLEHKNTTNLDINKPCKQTGETPLHLATQQVHSANVAQLCNEKSLNPDETESGKQPFFRQYRDHQVGTI